MEFCDLCSSAMRPTINKDGGEKPIYECKREDCDYKRESDKKIVSKTFFESTAENISIGQRLAKNIINDITHMRTTSYSCNKCKKVNTESVMIRDMQDMSITLVCCNIIGEEPCSNVWKLEN